MKFANHVKSAMVAAVVLALGLAFAPSTASAYSNTQTASMAVSATVNSNCAISAGALAFGSYSGSALTSTSTVSVTCTNTTAYAVGLNAGTGSSATVTNRLMTLASGTQTLGYGLYQDSGHATNWGNATGAWESGTGSGAAQTLTIYGQVPASQYPTPGSYSDTITVTVNY